MCIKIPPRTKDSVNRYKRILKKHKRKLKNSAAHLNTLSKLTNQNTTKVRSKIDNVFIDEYLKQEYAKFSLINFQKKELCLVGSLLDKIIYCYQITKSQNIDLINSIYHINFKDLWKKISKTLNLQIPQKSIGWFHHFYKHYLLPFEIYLFERKIINFTHLNQPYSFVIHQQNLTKSFITSHFEHQSHVILNFISPLFLNPQSFPILSTSNFKESESIKLSSVPAIQSIIKQKFQDLFLSSQSLKQQCCFPSIIKISEKQKSPIFYGSNSAIFFNMTDKNIQWFIVEDTKLQKVAEQLKINQSFLLENFNLIYENFSQLIVKECSIINLIQQSKQHLLLNAGCYAYSRSNQKAYLVQIPFEIKGSKQLNALLFRKSLHNNSSHKIPESAYKLKIFIQQFSSQQSFYLFQTHKYLHNYDLEYQQYNRIRSCSSFGLSNNLIKQNAFCKKCSNDILNYYYQRETEIICLQCILDSFETNLKICLRFQDTFVKGIFDKFKRMHLIHLKKEETIVENQRCTNYFKNLRPQNNVDQSNVQNESNEINFSNVSDKINEVNQSNQSNQSNQVNQSYVQNNKQILPSLKQTSYRSFLQITWKDSHNEQVHNNQIDSQKVKSKINITNQSCITIQEQTANFINKNKKRKKSKCNKQLSKPKNVSKNKSFSKINNNPSKSQLKSSLNINKFEKKVKKSTVLFNKVTTDEQ